MATSSARRRALDDLESFTESLSTEYLQCRDFGHQWRPFRAFALPRRAGYRRVLLCGRCGTERAQDISMGGSIEKGSYAYAEGYLTPKGSGAMTGSHRDFLRLESTLRLTSMRGIEHTDPAEAAAKVVALRQGGRKQVRRGA